MFCATFNFQTRSRMRMYYGKEFQVVLDSSLGKGTCFTFILPTPIGTDIKME